MPAKNLPGQTHNAPKLAQRIFRWLFLILSVLFAVLAVFIVYEETRLFNADAQFYSTLVLESKVADLENRLREFEDGARQRAGDGHAGFSSPPLQAENEDVYDYAAVRLYSMSLLQSGEVRIARYGNTAGAESLSEPVNPLFPDILFEQALRQRFVNGKLKTGWGKPFLLQEKVWKLPYAYGLSADRLLVMLAPLRFFFPETAACYQEEDIARLSMLRRYVSGNAGHSGSEDWNLAVVAMDRGDDAGGYVSGVSERNCLSIVESVNLHSSGLMDRHNIFSAPPDITTYSRTPVPGLFVGNTLMTARLYAKLRNYLFSGLLLALLALGLFAMVIRYALNELSQALLKILNQAEAISQGNLGRRLPEQQNYHELVQITKVVNNLVERLQSHVGKLQQETRKSTILSNEMAIAGRIQQDLLMTYDSEELCDRYQIDIGAFLAPAKQVAGDFYCLTPRPDGTLLFAVGDVSGKGIAAALVAKDCVSLLEANGKYLDMAALMQLLNATLYQRFSPQSMFATLFCCLLDPQSKTLTHCNAGHEAPLLYRRDMGQVECLPVVRNMALGFLPDVSYEVSTTRLRQDQCLLLYTDGLAGGVEQQGEVSELPLGTNALTHRLLQNVDMQTRLRCVYYLALEQQGRVAYDDITLLGVALCSNRYRSFYLPMEEATAGHAVTELRSRLGTETPVDCCNRLCIVLDEWVSNLNKYAGVDSDLIISCHYSADEVIMEIIARCRHSFNPLEVPELDVDEHLQADAVGGFGIHIIRNLVANLSYETEGRWTRLEVGIRR